MNNPLDHDLVAMNEALLVSAVRQHELAEQAQARYRRYFESARDGILILDPDTGRILDANPFMSELLGYTRDEFLDQELWELGLLKDQSGSAAALRELQERRYVRYENVPLKSNAGRLVEVEFIATVYTDGNSSAIQCIIRDITERNRLERETKEQAAALADLHRRKDEFLAMLSHELRSPLAPISNAVQVLRLQGDEELQQQARDIIERQVSQLKHLIDDLLEISRITTGRIHLSTQQVALHGIVQNAVETVRSLLVERGHALSLSFAPQPLWLNADPARLEQVVVNLLTNAAKYTPHGGRIELMVSVESQAPPASRTPAPPVLATIRVRDTGVGIAPRIAPACLRAILPGGALVGPL